MVVGGNSNRLIGQNGSRSFCRSAESSPMSSSTRGGSKCVSFSSEVSVFTQHADEDTTIATTEELAAELDEDVSPRSLFSGRWIESALDSNESRGVAVVEVTNTSPRMSLRGDANSNKRSEESHGDEPINRLERYRKTLLQRYEPPLVERSESSTCIPGLSKSDATMSPVEPLRVDTSETSCSSNLVSPTKSWTGISSTGGSPSRPAFNFEVLDSRSLGHDYEHDDSGPLSRKRQMWERIVDSLRATLVFVGYSFVVARESLCGEIVGIKLGGTFLLCCLSSLAASDHRGRMGCKKLTEIVHSRRTLLLVVYIVAWSYLVSTMAGLWRTSPSRAWPVTTTEKNRHALLWENAKSGKEWPFTGTGNSQTVEDLLDTDDPTDCGEINVFSLDLSLDGDQVEVTPAAGRSLETKRIGPYYDAFIHSNVLTPETGPALEPLMIPVAAVDEKVRILIEDDVGLDAERNGITAEVRGALEPRQAPSIEYEVDGSEDMKTIVKIDGDSITNGVVELDSHTPDSQQAMEPRIVPILSEEPRELLTAKVDAPLAERVEVDKSTGDQQLMLRAIDESVDSTRFATDNAKIHLDHHGELLVQNDGGTVIPLDKPEEQRKQLSLDTYSREPELGAGLDSDQKSEKNGAADGWPRKTSTGGASATSSNSSFLSVQMKGGILTEDVWGIRRRNSREEKSKAEMQPVAPTSNTDSTVSPSARVQKSHRWSIQRFVQSPTSTGKVDLANASHGSEAVVKMTEDRGVLYGALGKAARFASLLRLHVVSFLIGTDGRYKNQMMMDSLYEVWVRHFLA